MKNLVIVIIGIVFFTACSIGKENGKIIGSIRIDKDDFLLLYNYKSEEIADTIMIKDGILNYAYKINYPEIRHIEYQGVGRDIFLSPNGIISVKIENGILNIENNENALIDSLHNALYAIRLSDSENLTIEQTSMKLDSKFKEVQSIFNSIATQKNLPKTTSEYIDNTIKFHLLFMKSEYGLWYSIKDASYYTFLDSVKFEDKLLGTPQFRAFLDKYIAIKVMVMGPDSINILNPKKLFASAADYSNHFESIKIREYISFNYTHQYLKYFGTEGFEAFDLAFSRNNTDSVFAKQIRKTLDFKTLLAPGKIAPDFTCVNLNGDSISLKDFRGKNVLIDFWSSGCQPCREEFPYLIELQNTVSSNTAIISISLDSNIQNWKNALKQYKSNGIHLFAGEDDLRSKYQIIGVPSFVIIDKEGKILNSQPPRPSSPKLKEILEGLTI